MWALPTTSHQTQCPYGKLQATQGEARLRETVPSHSVMGERRKGVFRGPGSEVVSVTAFQSMRTLLLACLSHHTPPALTAFLTQHLHQVLTGLVWDATSACWKMTINWELFTFPRQEYDRRTKGLFCNVSFIIHKLSAHICHVQPHL